MTLVIIFSLVIAFFVIYKISRKTKLSNLPKKGEDKLERKEQVDEKILSVSDAQYLALLKTLESSLDWQRNTYTNEIIFSRISEYQDGYHNPYDENWFEREDSEIKFDSSEKIIILTKKLAREYQALPKDIFQFSPREYSVFEKWCNLRPAYERTHLSNIIPDRSELHLLTSEQLRDVRYYALRQWRATKSEDKQTFVEDIFTDRVLGLLVEYMPSTKEDLFKIPHVETSQWDKYGEKAVKIINKFG